MCRRSASSFVSPGPRVPMPPPSRDSQSPEPTSRGIRYLSCASSTWSWPSRVRARRAKMSRISCVRSMTASPVSFSRLRSCAGLSSLSTMTRSTSSSAQACVEHADLAAAQVERGVGRRAFLDEAQHDIRAGRAGQTVELFEAVIGGRAGDDAGGETDERRPLPPAAFLAAGHRLSHGQVGAATWRRKAIYRRNSNTRSKATGPSRMSRGIFARHVDDRRRQAARRRSAVDDQRHAFARARARRRRRWSARASRIGWRSSP